jgi:hypothetical protein
MRLFLYGFVAIALWTSAPAKADVYRCEDPDHGITYQQTPCPEPEEEATEEAENTADEPLAETPEEAPQERMVVGRDQSVEDVVAAAQEAQARSAVVRACKQKYRDAIDAIDLEIQNSYTPEQKEYYLGRLKALTEKMAAC